METNFITQVIKYEDPRFVWRDVIKMLYDNIVLVINNTEIQAHKPVLAEHSRYFKSMFDSGMKESCASRIELHDVNAETVMDIVNYFYTGKIKLTEDNIYSVISTLDFFCISKLRPLCSHFLWHFINVANCLHIIPVAEFYGYFDIAHSTFRFACKNFYQVMTYEDFLEVPYEMLIKFLTSPVLNVPDEVDLLIRLCDWVAYDVTHRINYSSNIFKYVKKDVNNDKLKEHLSHYAGDYGENIWETWKTVSYQGKDNEIFRCRTYAVIVLCSGGAVKEETEFFASVEVFNPFTVPRSASGWSSWSFNIPVCHPKNCVAEDKQFCIMPNLNRARCSHSCASTDDYVYVIGGRDETGHLSSVERYEPLDNIWHEVTPLPECLMSTASTYTNGKLYVTGGLGNNGPVNHIWVVDDGNNVWKSSTPMHQERYAHGVAAVNGFIYVFGGLDIHNKPLSTIECFDPYAKKWSFLPPMPEAKFSFGYAVKDAKIYVVGGSYINTKSVYYFDVLTYQWRESVALQSGFNGNSVVVVGGNFFVASCCEHCAISVAKFNGRIWSLCPNVRIPRLHCVLTTVRVPVNEKLHNECEVSWLRDDPVC